MEAIEIHAEVNGGEPTDNDIRRSDELEEARDQGLPHIREVTGRIGEELRGKHVRTKADCSAGGKYIRKAVSVSGRPEFVDAVATSPSHAVDDFVDVVSAGAGRSREEERERGTEVWLVFFLSSLLAGVYCLFVFCYST